MILCGFITWLSTFWRKLLIPSSSCFYPGWLPSMKLHGIIIQKTTILKTCFITIHLMPLFHKKELQNLTKYMQKHKWINYADCHNLYFFWYLRQIHVCQYPVCLPQLGGNIYPAWMNTTYVLKVINKPVPRTLLFTHIFYLRFPETKNQCYRPLFIW